MNNGDTFVPDNPNNYSIQFRPDGTVSIQADCNSVGGTYTVDGSSITIQTGPTTLVACPPGSLGDQFVTQLNGAAIYFIQGENLFIDLKFDSGTMQFTAQSSELAGSSWVVNGYNNGQEAVVSVIIGTEMTATFGEDGMLSGSAGCNTYNATYEVSGENISIGPAATTRKLCSEPEGIMEQEQQYLAALETAATYSIRGERLELRTATGALAASFNRARDVAGAIRGALEELQAQPERTQVWVDSVEIQMVDGEYVATIIGNYPDSCSTLGEVETTVEGDTVTVTVFAESPPDMMCASVLTPFEESITIDVSELEPGEYSVVVNETATTTLTIN
jgi:heat shock protein HslJ